MSTGQRRIIQEFRDITGQNERVASDHLRRHGWNLQEAVQFYYRTLGEAPVKQGNKTKIKKIFDKYAGKIIEKTISQP